MTTYTYQARCQGCDWRVEGPTADRAADKHTRDTGHPTSYRMTREGT